MFMGCAKTESLKGEAWARESRSSYSTLVSRRWQSNGASASVFGVGALSIGQFIPRRFKLANGQWCSRIEVTSCVGALAGSSLTRIGLQASIE